MYNINRRKFLGYFGCSCCSLLLPSCSTVPITERKQLSIISESRINRQAAAAKTASDFETRKKLIEFQEAQKAKYKTGPRSEQVTPAIENLIQE